MASSASRRPRTPAVRNPLRIAALVLLGLATALSAWLAYESSQPGGVPGCNAGDCATVLGSRWAKVFGVPVGVFGAAAYAILALLGSQPFTTMGRGPRRIGASLVLLIGFAAAWFAALQIFVLRAFCPWCTLTHALATAGAITMALAWVRDARQPHTGGRHAVRPEPVSKIWAAGIAGAVLALGLFVVAQVLSPVPPPPRIITASMSSRTNATAPATPSPTQAITATTNDSSPASATSEVTTPETAANPTAAPRRVTVHNGRFQLDPHALPVMGSPDATHLVVMISDYTCRYCRAAHRLLHGVREAFEPGSLGFIMLPSHHGGDSLAIQQFMLAAWKVDPMVWESIGDQLYGERLELKPATVRAALAEKIGAERLQVSLNENATWISELFALAKEITTANREVTRSGSIPQFIIGSEIVVGAPNEASEFFDLFAQHLGLVRSRLPELLLASGEVDIGRVFAGTQLPIILPFSNPGEAPLQISRVNFPLGGRVTQGLNTLVQPGSTSAVHLAFAVPRTAGVFESTVTLFSNARTSATPFRVRGEVWKPLTVTPEALDFGKIDAANASTQSVMRINFTETAYLDSVRSQNPGFAAELHEITPGREYEILVRTTPALGLGPQQTALVIPLREPVPDGWPRTLAFAARAIVERAVMVSPPRLILPAGELPDERHHQVRVRCTDGSPDFAVRGAVLEEGPPLMQPQISRGGGTNDFIVEFTLPAGWSVPAAPAMPRLVIETSHERYPTLEVPLVVQRTAK